MGNKEVYAELIAALKRWQKIENASVLSCSKILEKTDHPLLRAVMETIQADSQHHHHIQQLIIDSMEVKPFSLSPEDVAEVWDGIEQHQEIEKKTVEMADEILGKLKGNHLTAQDYLLRYLMEDEKKHNFMLDALEKVKQSLYPYA